MKTETQTAPPTVSPPGNLSVRDLAKSLIQTTPATAKTNEPAKPGAEAVTREGLSPDKETPPEQRLEDTEDISPEEQTRLEAKASETGKSVEDILAEEEAERTAATEEQTRMEAKAAETGKTVEEILAEEATQDERTTPAKAELPDELKDAIEIAKADGKKGTADLLKRVHKLVDERDTARNARLQIEEQNAQLRTELQEARKTEGGTAKAEPGALHPEVAKVVGELRNVDHWLGWCEQSPEGGELPDGKGGTMTLDAAQVKAIRNSLERERSEIVARKVQTERDVKVEYQQSYQQHHAAAVAQYPWLKNQNSPEHQEMQGILKVAPWFKQSPDFELAIGDFIAGKALRLAKAKVTGAAPRKPVVNREPTRVVAEPASSAQRRDPTKAKKDEADTQFKKSGKTKDLARSFAADRQASRTGG